MNSNTNDIITRQFDKSISYIKRWWKKQPDLIECNFGEGESQINTNSEKNFNFSKSTKESNVGANSK